MQVPYYTLVPLAALAASLAALLFLMAAPEPRSLRSPIIVFYSILTVGNLGSFGLAVSTSESDARLVFYCMNNVVPFLPVAFFWMACVLSGHAINRGLAVRLTGFVELFLSAFVVLIVNYSHWLTRDDQMFVARIAHFPWGFYPVNPGPGAWLFSVATVICITASLLVLAFPKETVHRRSVVRLRCLLVLFWLFVMTSYLPMNGIAIMPLGNAGNAVVAAVLVAVLYRDSIKSLSLTFMLRLTGALASVAMASIAGYVTAEFISGSAAHATSVIIASTAAIGVFVRFFPPGGPVHHDGIIFPENLTPQERRICEAVASGLPRDQLREHLRITAGTLKNHLKSIYRKTIDQGLDDPSDHRDKLQRLTAYLLTGRTETALPAASGRKPARLLRRVDPLD